MYSTEYKDSYCNYGGAKLSRPPTASYTSILPAHSRTSGKLATDAEYYKALPVLGNRPEFSSEQYPNVYRDTNLTRTPDNRWRYPNYTVTTKPHSRRLVYDATHPDGMYASQRSSDLVDPPGPHAFSTTTCLPAELPWTEDLSWQVNGEQSHWPTEPRRRWPQEAVYLPYNGHTDQPQYSRYKVHTEEVTRRTTDTLYQSGPVRY